jgi:purine-cytosine permease-like protein
MILLQVQQNDSTVLTPVEKGHNLIAEHIHLLTLLTAAIVVIGTVLLIRYYFIDRNRKRQTPNDNEQHSA